THVEPGATGLLRLDSHAPVGVWVMHCDLKGVTRVDVETRTPSGELLFTVTDVPFDQERGQVLLAGQLHYRSLPALLHAPLSERVSGNRRELGRYILDHQFETP